jgi:D-alanyl-lipoteichoic acid acyltransferase DltB (MBOAT superfamily)
MVFNSFCFAPFLLLAVLSQAFVASWPVRKATLILCSYAFYAAWYPLAIVLLWASTLFDFFVARAVEKSASSPWRRGLLIGSVALNLGVLFSFKYLGFAVDNLNRLAGFAGHASLLARPAWILPVGISFYTFMSLSYVVDVYRSRRRAETSLLDFALFLSFFPHLVAGPIVRADDFLPQCKAARRPTIHGVCWGLLLLTLGLFQKVVMADAWFGPLADRVFDGRAGQASTADAWLAAIAFSGQIFSDFAGYSTCAVGAAACLGFRLPENFRSPYAAVGFSDFWRRWHITLSGWLRDYVYVSLGGNRYGTGRTLLNLMLTMLLGGLWHGAAWTFVIWGVLHGAFLCAERGVRRGVERFRIPQNAWTLMLASGTTLLGVTWAWVFFRAPTFARALELTRAMSGAGGRWSLSLLGSADALMVLLPVLGLLVAQWWFKERSLVAVASKVPTWLLAGASASMLLAIMTMAGEDRAFIYFQF